MFLFEVVGYVDDAEVYCPDHAPSTDTPIFAEHSQPGDYCVECLAEYHQSISDKPIRYQYPASANAPWVYLEGCQPA